MLKKASGIYGPRKCETSSAAVVFFEQEPCQDDAIAPGASVSWRWLERCLESFSAPDIALLRDAVPEQKDRMRILAVLGDKTMGQGEGLHLTLASLDAVWWMGLCRFLLLSMECNDRCPAKLSWILLIFKIYRVTSPPLAWSICCGIKWWHCILVLCFAECIGRKTTWMVSFGGVHHRIGHVGSGEPFVGCSHA